MPEVRCPTDNKLLFVPSDDFTGPLGGWCRGCKVGVEYPTGAPPAVDKLLCKCGAWVGRGKVETGSLQTFCRREKVLIRFTPTETIYLEPPPEKPRKLRPAHLVPKVPSTPVARLRDDELIDAIKRHWEKLRADDFRRRAEIAVGLRFDVFSRDGFRCRYCGRGPDNGVTLEADHVIPRSAGGPDTMRNLVTACWDCNRGKAAKVLDMQVVVDTIRL